jgi:hypothetical protein
MILKMRTRVSETELLRVLNAELAKYEDCDDCGFHGPVRRLREPDGVGANWSDVVKVRCGGRSIDGCTGIVGRVITEVRKSYNLE